MPSFFDSVFEVAAAQPLDSVFGTHVQLRRGALTSLAFTAVWSAQEYQTLSEDLGVNLTVRKRVYRFAKADCVLAGSAAEPRAGDRLIDGDETLEIVPVEGKPAVESEPGGYRWLVRTNRVV